MSRTLSVLSLLIWSAVVVWSMATIRDQAPLMAIAGPILSALAPLLFVAGVRRWAMVTEKDAHPVIVSVLSGFGIVLAMIATTRFGDQYESHVIAAGLALLVWLVWVRWSWRARADS